MLTAAQAILAPAGSAEAPAQPDPKTARGARSASPNRIQKEHTVEMVRPKVLIVEDDRVIREALSSLLAEEGYRVDDAENGRHALDLLGISPETPSIILLDLMMPVMDGWQFYAELRKDSRLASIPIIVLSADGHVSEKASSIRAAGFIAKPFDFERLLDALESAIRGAS